MARARHEERGMAGGEAEPRVRRRGLMAGAAALVAALAAKGVTERQPVAADGGTWTLPYHSGFQSYSGYLITLYNQGVGGGGLFVEQAYTGTAIAGSADRSGTGVSGSSGNGIGVQGTADSLYVPGIGVFGSAHQGYGVVGNAAAGDVAALYGNSNGVDTPAFAAYNSVAGGLAGTFNGAVYINGSYTATGTKSAAVPHPDGSHRLLYCMEAPEAWFEDFGEAALAGGKAEVRLDPDFAAVVDTSTLHVFLTPHDESHHLAVKARSATGFMVAAGVSGEAAARGLKASDVSGTFTWRVVAKRKDVQAARLAKVELPKIPAPPPPPPAEPKPKAPVRPTAP